MFVQIDNFAPHKFQRHNVTGIADNYAFDVHESLAEPATKKDREWAKAMVSNLANSFDAFTRDIAA